MNLKLSYKQYRQLLDHATQNNDMLGSDLPDLNAGLRFHRYPIIPVNGGKGNYMVFIACEYCHTNKLDRSGRRCANCGAPVSASRKLPKEQPGPLVERMHRFIALNRR